MGVLEGLWLEGSSVFVGLIVLCLGRRLVFRFYMQIIDGGGCLGSPMEGFAVVCF